MYENVEPCSKVYNYITYSFPCINIWSYSQPYIITSRHTFTTAGKIVTALNLTRACRAELEFSKILKSKLYLSQICKQSHCSDHVDW